MLYVVFDDTGRCLVSRDDPAPSGRAERADYDGVVAIALAAPHDQDWAATAPDLDGNRLLAGSVMLVVAGATLAASALVSPWVAVPAGAAATVYVGRRHNIAAARAEARWASRHRILDTRAEVARFRRAFDAARTILVAWPYFAELVQVPSPRREVSASLWTIAGLLRDHADLAEQHVALSEARFGDLPAHASVRGALDERLARVEAAQRALSAEIDRRLEPLTDLAARSASFVRAEAATHVAHEAVRRADEAVRRADESLGRVAAPAAPPDETRELAERTAAIIKAYRELTDRT
ncbi:hypothetical protein [Dactylosporangium sp. CA-233914]|uniref:hypothetical protein n=1 Tax=Dactylosporangium sp. CA-233914 TaxID=3239934 RepID=UPI003D92A2FC